MSSRGSDSWDAAAEWYAAHLEDTDTYHARVVIPNVLRVLSPERGMRVLDLACGEGILTREIAATGADAHGVDVSQTLISFAQKKGGGTYHVSSAESLPFEPAAFDAVVCVLALQNMERPEKALDEVARVLTSHGRFIMVLNHPVLRVPKRSSWGFDAEHKVQYRRLDGYYRSSKEKMLMHPAKGDESEHTWSYQRPLDAYAKMLFNRGFVISGLEEWLSHKTSERGPRKEAEDLARKEFPLFLMIEARK